MTTSDNLSDRGSRLRDATAGLWAALGNAVDVPLRALQQHIGAHRMAYVFVLPNLLVFGIFTFWPMLLNFYIAFTGGTSVIVTERPIVGLDNFRELLACPSWLEPKSCPVAGYSFWTGVWNTLFFAIVQVPIMIVVALATALVLNREICARGFWRAVYFYPVMLSPVVVAVIWDWILKRRGILNALLSDAVEGWNGLLAKDWGHALVSFAIGVLVALALRRLLVRYGSFLRRSIMVSVGFLVAFASMQFMLPLLLKLPDHRPVNWLIDARSGWPMFWVIFVYTWAHVGFYMLILLAGLQAIPKDLYEAAEMDGTSQTRQLFRITLPLLMPTLIVVLVLSLIKAFQVFDEVYVLTGGGPGQATKMIVQHIYEMAFIGDAKRYGIAAASSVLVAGALLFLTLIQLAATRKRAGG